MKWQADEAHSWRIAEMLRAVGEDAVHVSETGQACMDDAIILERVRAAAVEGSIVVIDDTNLRIRNLPIV